MNCILFTGSTSNRFIGFICFISLSEEQYFPPVRKLIFLLLDRNLDFERSLLRSSDKLYLIFRCFHTFFLRKFSIGGFYFNTNSKETRTVSCCIVNFVNNWDNLFLRVCRFNCYRTKDWIVCGSLFRQSLFKRFWFIKLHMLSPAKVFICLYTYSSEGFKSPRSALFKWESNLFSSVSQHRRFLIGNVWKILCVFPQLVCPKRFKINNLS